MTNVKQARKSDYNERKSLNTYFKMINEDRAAVSINSTNGNDLMTME